MKKIFSIFAMLMAVSAVMADNGYYSFPSSYSEQGVDGSLGYFVNIYAENYMLSFEIQGATEMLEMHNYNLTDMIQDSTFVAEIKGVQQYDVKQVISCTFIKVGNEINGQMITNANDTFVVEYVEPTSTVQLMMANDTNFIVDAIATDSVIQIVAVDPTEEYTLNLAFKNVSQVEGVYFNKDVLKEDNVKQYYSRIIHKTAEGQDTIGYHLLAPMTYIQLLADSAAMGVVGINGDDNITYEITFTAKIKGASTAIENVAADQKKQGTKFLQDGKLYIRKDEVIYDAKGTRVE